MPLERILLKAIVSEKRLKEASAILDESDRYVLIRDNVAVRYRRMKNPDRFRFEEYTSGISEER